MQTQSVDANLGVMNAAKFRAILSVGAQESDVADTEWVTNPVAVINRDFDAIYTTLTIKSQTAVKDVSLRVVDGKNYRVPLGDLVAGTNSIKLTTPFEIPKNSNVTVHFEAKDGSDVILRGTGTAPWYRGFGSKYQWYKIAPWEVLEGLITKVNNLPKRATGTVDQTTDPKLLAEGDYYVTEKFVGAPDGLSDYVGMLTIDTDFDGNNNGAIIRYYAKGGVYTLYKYSGGWDTSWNLLAYTTPTDFATKPNSFTGAATLASSYDLSGVNNIADVTGFINLANAGTDEASVDLTGTVDQPFTAGSYSAVTVLTCVAP